MNILHASPIYGDFSSKKKVIEHYLKNKDFYNESLLNGTYLNKQDVENMNVEYLNVRYKNKTQVAVIEVKKYKKIV